MSWSAVLAATAAWVLEPELSEIDWEFPLVFPHSQDFLAFAFLLAPLIAVGLLIYMLVMTLRYSPRPLSVIYFFGVCSLWAAIESYETSNTFRWICAMFVGSFAMTLEAVIRLLPKQQIRAAVSAWVVTICAYFFEVAVILISAR